MWQSIKYFFPTQLLILNFRKNLALILVWLLLFGFLNGNIGKVFGIPYLFLDPEYLGTVGYWSFFIIGISLGGFTMAYHIACYIIDSQKFNFLGSMKKPFTRFCVNNAVIPLLFLGVYVVKIYNFQSSIDFLGVQTSDIWWKIGGLLSGFFIMTGLLFTYFIFTNKDVFKIVASSLDQRLKKVKVTRVKVMHNYKEAKGSSQPRVDHFVDINFKIRRIKETSWVFDKEAVLKVFDQNHLNMVLVELLIFLVILVLGIFREYPYFQIPAAASGILLFTIILMFVGAFTYWFRGWSVTLAILIFLVLNYITGINIFQSNYEAYGLDYSQEKVAYSIPALKSMNQDSNYLQDKQATLKIFENWKKKLPEGIRKPKMVIVCTSGGGQRSALWTMKVLQTADSITGGKLMDHTFLITGASGGLVGASYFRELHYRQQIEEDFNKYDHRYLDNISKDILNPVIFSLLVNDLFIRFQRFEYAGKRYPKDRGYTFEETLNQNLGGLMDRKLMDYYLPEYHAEIPMLLIAPTIVNDGRKLYISPQPVSYMNTPNIYQRRFLDQKLKGIDFRAMFKPFDADSLRFISALRMNATFPYITPTVTLPSEPLMQIMDAGISDNFGIYDAVRFLFVFKDWVAENTSGVVFVSIRDSEKDPPIKPKKEKNLSEKLSTPLQSLYNNWDSMQDISNDNLIEYAQSWFEGDVHRIEFQYLPRTFKSGSLDGNNEKEAERASLSWHLTEKEKRNIVSNIELKTNQDELRKLELLLQ